MITTILGLIIIAMLLGMWAPSFAILVWMIVSIVKTKNRIAK